MTTLTPKMSQRVFISLFADAVAAANKAGDAWMENAKPMFSIHSADIFTGTPTGPELGTMLDLCGNAHMKFKDKRSAWFKVFAKFGKLRDTASSTIDLNHKYSYRQEHGLKLACIGAARKVFEDVGITGIVVWDYID